MAPDTVMGEGRGSGRYGGSRIRQVGDGRGAECPCCRCGTSSRPPLKNELLLCVLAPIATLVAVRLNVEFPAAVAAWDARRCRLIPVLPERTATTWCH